MRVTFNPSFLVLALFVGPAGCADASAEESPRKPLTSSAVSVELPPTPAAPAAQHVASLTPSAAASKPLENTLHVAPTALPASLKSRADAVRAALLQRTGANSSLTVPADGRAQVLRFLRTHGILASDATPASEHVWRCPSDANVTAASCWLDTLVWAHALLVDGVGLGARSQPLPPHRKRLTSKEKDTLKADRERRQLRAVEHVVNALDGQQETTAAMQAWLQASGPGQWSVYRGLVDGLATYRELASQPQPQLSADFPTAKKHAWRSRKQRRAWLAEVTAAQREQVRLRLCFEGYCATKPQLVAATASEAAPLGGAVPTKAPTARTRKRRKMKVSATPLDADLRRELAAWQADRGLRPSGVTNKETLQQLRVPMSQRVQQLRLALQRIRDAEVGSSADFLIANVPSFRLDVWRNRALNRSHLTQVGKGRKRVRRKVRGKKRWLWVPGVRTPLIHSKLKALVINPEWVVPSSIRREYRFKIAGDENWLANNGFEMRPASNGGSFMVMKSGPTNLLGQVKFMFANTHLVYLHDTPNKRGFKYPVRTRSHGCVRVDQAFELARDLLAQDQEKRWSEKKWTKYLVEHSNKWVRLKSALDLHIAYWTADVSEQGRVRFYRDYYNFDEADARRMADFAKAHATPAGSKGGQMPAGPSTPAVPEAR